MKPNIKEPATAAGHSIAAPMLNRRSLSLGPFFTLDVSDFSGNDDKLLCTEATIVYFLSVDSLSVACPNAYKHPQLLRKFIK